MSFIITNGSQYCHRTRTRAVEIVDSIDQATRFKDRETAENLLARATKKLSGFQVETAKDSTKKDAAKDQAKKDVTVSAAPAPVSGEKEPENAAKPAPRRRGRKPRAKTEDSTVSISPSSADAQTLKEDASSAEPQAPKAHEASAETQAPKGDVSSVNAQISKEHASLQEGEATNPAPAASREDAVQPEAREHSSSRGRRGNHRGGRRRKTAQTAVETETAENTSAQAPVSQTPVQEDAPAAQKPKFQFKVEVHQVGSTGKAAEHSSAAASDEAQEQQSKSAATPNEAKEQQPKSAVSPATPDAEKQQQAKSAAKAAREDAQPAAASHPSMPVITVTTTNVSAPKPREASKAPDEDKKQAAKVPAASKLQAPAAETIVFDPVPAQAAAPQETSGTHTDASSDAAREQNGRGRRRRGGKAAPALSVAEPFTPQRQETTNIAKPIGPETEPRDSTHGHNDNRRGRGNTRKQTGKASSSPAKAMANQTDLRRRFTTAERNLVYNRTEGHCGICGRFIPLEEYTIDHIIPLSKGGTNDLDNLQACCGFCNKAKDDSMGDEFFKRIEHIFLYQARLKYGKKEAKRLKKTIKELDEGISEI